MQGAIMAHGAFTIDDRKEKTGISGAVEKFGPHDHAGLVYERPEERALALAPYIRTGLERGEKCVYVTDEKTAAETAEMLYAQGLDLGPALSIGAFEFFTKEDGYIKEGVFDPGLMFGLLEAAADLAKAQGYKVLRGIGEFRLTMGGPGRFMEFEAKLNDFIWRHDVIALCLYNRAVLPPEVLLEALHAHPLIIHGGRVCKNFFYATPEEMLRGDRAALEADRLLKNIAERGRMEELRERVQRHLFSAEKVLRDLIEASPLPMAILEKNRRVLCVNRKFTELLGYTVKDMPTMEKWWVAAFPDPEYRRSVRAAWDRILEQAVTVEPQEAEVRCKDGSTLAMIMHLSSIGERDLVILKDVTENRRIQTALAESEHRFRELATHVPVGIYQAGPEGECVFVNERWCEMTGMSPAEAMDRGWVMALHPDDRERIDRAWNEMVKTGGRWSLEYRFIGPDGKVTWVHGRAKPIKNDSGKITGYIGTNIDITERKLALDALNERKNELNGINNELKEALRKVKLLSGMLPICAACKKIRNDKGFWETIEKFIRAHSEAEFSHGICPECEKKLYPEFTEKKE